MNKDIFAVAPGGAVYVLHYSTRKDCFNVITLGSPMYGFDYHSTCIHQQDMLEQMQSLFDVACEHKPVVGFFDARNAVSYKLI